MAAALRHRGPDDEGVWSDPACGVALGHRRLAIQDLSQEGHQPMSSVDGRYLLVFNGEIYNFLELREALEAKGRRFRGHSDTEVMLAAFCEWGVEMALERFTGMFAFALWDRELHRLHLARDRAGEKPLYYGWSGGVFLFTSELKALREHPDWQPELDRDALAAFVRYSYVPAPHSIYCHIQKLPPGSLASLTDTHFATRTLPVPRRYWSLSSVARAGGAAPFQGDEREAGDRLRELLEQSIARQMIADVPVGAFLSGGIDSSLVLALMQAQSARPVKTFSIGFSESSHDEAPFAQAVARHLGTQHTELYVGAGMLLEALPRMLATYDEPFADTSHLPTLLLCELARKQVTVALTGDGGDELFGGYSLYQRTQQLWNLARLLPDSVRPRLTSWLHRTASRGIDFQNRLGSEPCTFERIQRLAEILRVPNERALYRLQVSSCRDPQAWLTEDRGRAGEDDSTPWGEELGPLLRRMMFQDFLTYLPDEVLAKVDRASMSVSLETRIPLLDHQIIAFAWSLPVSLLQQRGRGKWLMRQLLHRYVPVPLVDRPKQGFAAPIDQWLRGDLRPWAEDLLAPASVRQGGLFQERTVTHRWQEHVASKRNWGRPLWNILMFQGWFATQNRRPALNRATEQVTMPATEPEFSAR